jgi:valyl-tRNA synthetase
MTTLMDVTREVRNIRSTYNIPPARRLPLTLRTTGPAQDRLLESAQGHLASLARLSRLTWGQDVAVPAVAATVVVRNLEIHVPLEGLIDLTEERERLNRELAKVEQALERVSRKLANPDFVGKAPAAVVSQQRAAQAELQDARATLQESLKRLSAQR